MRMDLSFRPTSIVTCIYVTLAQFILKDKKLIDIILGSMKMWIFILGIIAILAIHFFGDESAKEKQRESFKLAGLIIGIPVGLILIFLLWIINQ